VRIAHFKIRNLSHLSSPKKIIDLVPFSCRFGHTRFDVSAESQYDSEQQRSNWFSNIVQPKGDLAMRFMVIVKSTPETEGAAPDPQFLAEMGKYNEELIKAGIVLAMDGLHPSSKGARVKFSGKNRKVIDGPFTEAKELVAGFWLWQVKSLEEAIEWVKRGPSSSVSDYEVEIRQVFEMEDFAPILSEEQTQYKIAKRAQLPNQTFNK
jgi:hypothetical protein